MSSRPSGPAYPWRLRIEHEGSMSLRLDRRGRAIRFDPQDRIDPQDIVILTGCWPEHLDATRDAVRRGLNPTVVAPQAVLDWLARHGAFEAHRSPAAIDGVEIEQRAFVPIPYVTPKEALYKVQSAVLRPDRAARRLLQRSSMPAADPAVTRLTFSDGSTLVHASLSLHRTTPEAWLEGVIMDWGQPEWLILGVDHGHGPDVLARVGRFGATHVLFTDLLSEMRRRLGFPTELLTPVRDQAAASGMAADVFVSGAGLRYE